MFRIYNLLIVALLLSSTSVFARKGGDDVGNGGQAYRQSVIILKMATEALTEKIRTSTLKDIVENPSRRLILQNTLGYDSLNKLSKKNKSRGGKLLAMDYTVNPQVVLIYEPYFVAFSGKTDTELEDASLEVQKRLLHEAAHIWGYNEDKAEEFAIAFLKNSKYGMERPRNFNIKADYCACRNGKSDIYSKPACDSFCASKPNTMNAILYAEVDFPTDHPVIHNLYDWCTVQLYNDVWAPQCFLKDTNSEALLPMSITQGKNSFSVNINSFNLEEIKKLKLEEQRSEASSNEFSLKRKLIDNLGMLKTMPVNQYTCFKFGGSRLPNGDVIKDSYARTYYYFNFNESPNPVPSRPADPQMILCHDDQIHPGEDSAMYPRLELQQKYFTGWDRTDPRFGSWDGKESKSAIDKFVENRLLDEYNIKTSVNLFIQLDFPHSPEIYGGRDSFTPLTFISIPYTKSGKSFCPTSINYKSEEPLFKILRDYLPETEGLYLAEKEAESINNGGDFETVYATVFATESTLKYFGFYVENGIKIKATLDDLHTKQIYFYGPVNINQDPLVKGNRKLFTVKQQNELNSTNPVHGPILYTSDKRIGCIPKGELK